MTFILMWSVCWNWLHSFFPQTADC